MIDGRETRAAASEHPREWEGGWRFLFWILMLAGRAKPAAWRWIPADRPVKGWVGLVEPEIPVVQPVGPRLRGGAPRAVALPALN